MSLDRFLLFIFLAAAVAGTTSMSRALPWPKSWLEMKLWQCPSCYSGWHAFIVLGAAHWTGLWVITSFSSFAFMWLACLPLSMIVFKTLYPPDIELPMPGDETDEKKS